MMSLRKFAALVVLLAGISFHQANAIQLGDTRQDVAAAGGGAAQAGPWKVEVRYVNDAVRELTFTKPEALRDEDVMGILDEQGGRARWTAVILTGETVELWRRKDGATARRDPLNKRVLVLEAGRGTVRPQPKAGPGAGSPLVSNGTGNADAAVPEASAPAEKSPWSLPSGFPTSLPPFFSTSLRHVVPPGRETMIKLALLVGVIVALKLVISSLGKRRTSIRRSSRGVAAPEQPWQQQQQQSQLQPQWQPPQTQQQPPSGKISLGGAEPVSSSVPTMGSTSGADMELVIGEAFRRRGYQVEIAAAHGPDGGVDLRLRRDGALTLVQCKHWKIYKVGVEKIREFLGVMTAEKVERGIFVNTGVYSQEAMRFVKGTAIELMNGEDVKGLILSVTRPGENIYDIKSWVEEFRVNSTITEPDCPYCHAKMVLRDGKMGRFWGCVDFPRCTGKRMVRGELMGG